MTRIPLWLAAILSLLLTPAKHALSLETAERPLKYHPGHYISLARDDGHAEMREAGKPGVTGIQKRYLWADLEPAPGRYEFSRIESDLELASRLGLQLVVFIEDKTFSDVVPIPAYLRQGRHALPLADSQGWIAKRWDPVVIERFSALLTALGSRFDGHPGFEGVALQESALSLDMGTARAHGYEPEAYRDALIEILVAARRAFPRSQVFWYMNFLEGGNAYLADIATALVPHRIAMGGPDVLPDNASLRRHAYPLYERFKGELTLFCSIQNVSYAHPRRDGAKSARYWTMEQLFEFARDELHVEYLFWNRKNWRKPPDSYDWTDALPVIRDHPRFN